jgi:hypothetical protein
MGDLMNKDELLATLLAVTNTLWIMNVYIHPIIRSKISGVTIPILDKNHVIGAVALIFGIIVYFIFGIILRRLGTKIWLNPKFD